MHVNPSCRIHSAGVAAPAGLSSYFKAMVRQLHSCEDSWVASAHGLRLSGGQLSCCSQRGMPALLYLVKHMVSSIVCCTVV